MLSQRVPSRVKHWHRFLHLSGLLKKLACLKALGSFERLIEIHKNPSGLDERREAVIGELRDDVCSCAYPHRRSHGLPNRILVVTYKGVRSASSAR